MKNMEALHVTEIVYALQTAASQCWNAAVFIINRISHLLQCQQELEWDFIGPIGLDQQNDTGLIEELFSCTKVSANGGSFLEKISAKAYKRCSFLLSVAEEFTFFKAVLLNKP